VYQIHALTMFFTGGDLWASCIALPLWGFTGGLGFLECFGYGVAPPGSLENYVHQFFQGKVAFWFQSLTHIYHPQRSATVAIPLCYIIFHALLTRTEKFELHSFVFATLIVGVTPQTQVHAFASLGLFSLALAATTFPFEWRFGRCVKSWTVFGVLANVIAFPLWRPFVQRATTSNEFFDYRPIWRNGLYSTIPGGFLGIWWK
jgi:hypothetical protein